MFTVLSNTRNNNLYLAAALAIVMVLVVWILVAAQTILAPAPVLIPVTSMSTAGSDYYERHPELRLGAAAPVDATGDFYLRHPGWISAKGDPQVIIPVTGSAVYADYFERHPELNRSSMAGLGGSDFFMRHPGWTVPAGISVDLSDYYLRQRALLTTGEAVNLDDYFLRHSR